MNYEEAIERLAQNPHQDIFNELLKESMRAYRLVTDVFIQENVEVSESFRIMQDIANILFAFKTKMDHAVPKLATEDNIHLYSKILDIFEIRKYTIDYAFTISQCLADSIWVELTGTVNPIGFGIK